ncbi:MAG: putative quinol monooxygenase [Parashewanella sp.]
MLVNEGIWVTAVLEINDKVDVKLELDEIEHFCQQMESEAGCIMATASQDKDNPRRVVLWEVYQDEKAINAHFEMPHTQAFINRKTTTLIHAHNSLPLGAK